MAARKKRLMSRNRKRSRAKQFSGPEWLRIDPAAVNWPRMAMAGAVASLAFCAYAAALWVMDRPIESVLVNGSFERVTALQVEDALDLHLDGGFLTADLRSMRAELLEIPWVANANVRRRWPGTIEVHISEERPAACWGRAGLLNTDGDLFVEEAQHVPAELPRLTGPAGSERRVAKMFFRIEQRLEQRGMAAVALRLDQRGAWEVQLSSGIRVRLGASFVEQRLDRFFKALDQVIAAESERVDYVDMRYTNGFAVGWKDRQPMRARSREEAEPNV
jgi:cell division protein FtsQ